MATARQKPGGKAAGVGGKSEDLPDRMALVSRGMGRGWRFL